MLGPKRLAQRSIVGTKVCAERQDGRLYQGTIQSIQHQPNDEQFYSVVFGDGESRVYKSSELVGHGFKSITSVRLKQGQQVYATNNGREVQGEVKEHNKFTDDVIIVAKVGSQDLIIERQLEEIRLTESRKSPRLKESKDTDYSKMADFPLSDAKRRAVSHVIDVPGTVSKTSRRRKASPDLDEMLEEMDDVRETSVASASAAGDQVTMDTKAAALLLTRLSAGTLSPPRAHHNYAGLSTSSGIGSSVASVTMYTGASRDASTPASFSPSPPIGSAHGSHAHSSGSYPISSSAPTKLFSGRDSNSDEGIDLGTNDVIWDYYEDKGPKRKRTSSKMRTVYQCNWRECNKVCNTVEDIERHVRREHLGRSDSNRDSDASEGDEEFYYIEVEVDVDTVTRTFADMHTGTSASPTEPDNYLGDEGEMGTGGRLEPHPFSHRGYGGKGRGRYEAAKHAADGGVDDLDLDDDDEHILVVDEPIDLSADHQNEQHQNNDAQHVAVTQANEAQALDHDYQKKVMTLPHSLPSPNAAGAGGGRAHPVSVYDVTGTNAYRSHPSSTPIQIPNNISKSLSWQSHDYAQFSPSKYSRSFGTSGHVQYGSGSSGGGAMHAPRASSSGPSGAGGGMVVGAGAGAGAGFYRSDSPKASPSHHGYKKSRSDVKKCRKVYGVDNKEAWCKQCLWKKACTRFTGGNVAGGGGGVSAELGYR